MNRLQLPEEKEEIDVEGLEIEEDRLWIVGSLTSARKGIKPRKDPEENLRRLAQVEARPNRYLRDDRLRQTPEGRHGPAPDLGRGKVANRRASRMA